MHSYSLSTSILHVISMMSLSNMGYFVTKALLMSFTVHGQTLRQAIYRPLKCNKQDIRRVTYMLLKKHKAFFISTIVNFIFIMQAI